MDILFPPPQFASKPPESIALIRDVLMAILEDDDSYATWSSTSNAYYDRMAKCIEKDDAQLADDIKSMAAAIRARYRTNIQHELYTHQVPMHRTLDPSVETALEDACCVCLQNLNSYKKVVRLRSRDPEQACGHFLHQDCMARLIPGAQTGSVSCPMCRANLGYTPVLRWYDMERATPEF